MPSPHRDWIEATKLCKAKKNELNTWFPSRAYGEASWQSRFGSFTHTRQEFLCALLTRPWLRGVQSTDGRRHLSQVRILGTITALSSRRRGALGGGNCFDGLNHQQSLCLSLPLQLTSDKEKFPKVSGNELPEKREIGMRKASKDAIWSGPGTAAISLLHGPLLHTYK